jgi:iron complex transport system ATP-binding protein
MWARAVTVRAGRQTLLARVSVEIIPGEVLVVVGPNGAGKSTLLRALAGDIQPDEGEITLDDRPLPSFSREALARRRAVLLQHSPLAFDFRVREVVRFGRAPFGSAPDDELRVQRALDDVGLGGWEDRRYPTLSGGERQRVQLARVLTQLDPPAGRYLLLDEPTASLDVAHAQLVVSLARRAAARGAGALVVMHDLNLAFAHADRVLLLHRGQTEALGPPDEVATPELLGAVYEATFEKLSIRRPPGFVLAMIGQAKTVSITRRR